ncbi:MAG: cation acetate symporter [Beijerinckiaceae bacterium]|nr:cation acetate symporter [Beijerinckiaceae bacterium]MCZ8302002.1 cation acetate symporter [Beijerinckiaceae bacterium]
MANASADKGSFLNNLGRIYALYTGGFFGFIFLVGILEQLGVGQKYLGYMFMGLTILVYAFIGVVSRTSDVGEYYVAGRTVPAFYNGMATGADWMSAASFIGMAGTLFLLGYDGLAFVLGWTGGYVLVAVLIAPFLRKFGAYTVPDFLAARYGGNAARLCGVIVLLACSFTYVVAQIFGTGLIAQRFLDMNFELACFVGLMGILVCSMLGGMKAVTWTQVAQYIVLIVAYLIPVVWMSAKKFGIPVPQFTYGQALQQIATLEQEFVQKGLAAASAPTHTAPFTRYSPANYFWLIFCLMVGTASLPHVLMRYFTTPSVREARQSVAWSLLFIFILYFTAPAYAAFSKLEVYSTLIGKNVADLPAWVFNWGKLGLITICGKSATAAADVVAACKALPGHAGLLRLQDFVINTDVVVISTPEIAGLPYVITGLVAAGGLAAALSTADGLLLALANALSHDIYYKMINPNAPTKQRLVISRVLLVVVAVLAAWTASTRPTDIVAMVAWAFSLAAGGLFPALVLGVWWKRTTKQGAIAGILAGFGVTLFYLVITRYWPHIGVQYFGMVSNLNPITGAPLISPEAMKAALSNPALLDGPVTAAHPLQSRVGWFNINNISSAAFGLPVGFVVMYVVSLMTPAPSAELQRFIDEVRKPRGKTLMDEKGGLVASH